MTRIKEIRSALLQMQSQIERLRAYDLVETAQSLKNLRKNLEEIEQKELEETRENLRDLTVEISSIGKKEFSFMRIFGLEDDELVHSSFLAWLLDPLESHALGSFFIERLLKRTGLEIEDLDFSNLHVEKEISGDKSRLDIRVFDNCGKFQCIIENKIWSSEGADQTMRLYNDFHDEAYEKELFIFLTLIQKKPKDDHFISVNYEQVLAILTELLEVAEGDTRFLIKHYSNTLERLIMSEKFEGFSERTQLYYQYYKYTSEIKRAFEKDRKLLLDTLEKAIKENSWWDENSWKIKRSGGDLAIWKDAWYLSKREGVYLQLYMHITELGFAIRIYGEPSEFAAKLMPILRRLTNEKYPEKIPGGLRKKFSATSSRFLEKEIRFSPTEKNQIKKILESLNEIIGLFDDTIKKSINELERKG